MIAQPECAAEAGSLCARFYEWTGNDFLSRAADTIVDKTLTVGLIVLLALLVRYIAHRLITRAVEGAADGDGKMSRLLGRAPHRVKQAAAPLVSARRAQRARTIGSVLRSITSAVVLVTALIMILAEFGVALAPILASAGIVGIAIGFGAQNLVRDFLSGMFMLLEDQYGVGDIVDVGEAIGTVEAVGLRITTLRDVQGTVWYVRNGEILRVGNKSQGHAIAVVDLPLAHSADIAEATEIVTRVADEVVARPEIAPEVQEPPEVLGIERVGPEGVTFRVTVRTNPGQQWTVQRALHAAIGSAFDDAGLPRPAVFPGGQAAP